MVSVKFTTFGRKTLNLWAQALRPYNPPKTLGRGELRSPLSETYQLSTINYSGNRMSEVYWSLLQ